MGSLFLIFNVKSGSLIFISLKKIYNKKINIKKENKFRINRSLDSTRFTLQTGYIKKNWDIMILENKRFFFRYAKQKN